MKTPRAKTNMLRFFSLAAAAGLFFAACSPPADPRTAPISAATPGNFAEWKNDAYARANFSSAERDEFEQCINQVRIGIRMRNEAVGDAAVAQALCDRINGKTIREVLIMAYSSEAGWIPGQIEAQRATLAKTDAVLDGPGSDNSKAGARAFRVAVVDAIDKLEARLAKVKTRLEELQKDGP
jgi:hypothetical protein